MNVQQELVLVRHLGVCEYTVGTRSSETLSVYECVQQELDLVRQLGLCECTAGTSSSETFRCL